MLSQTLVFVLVLQYLLCNIKTVLSYVPPEFLPLFNEVVPLDKLLGPIQGKMLEFDRHFVTAISGTKPVNPETATIPGRH